MEAEACSGDFHFAQLPGIGAVEVLRQPGRKGERCAVGQLNHDTVAARVVTRGGGARFALQQLAPARLGGGDLAVGPMLGHSLAPCIASQCARNPA